MLVCRPWSVRMIDPAFWTSLQTGYQNLWPNTKWDKPKPNYSRALDYARGCVLNLELNVPGPICLKLLHRLVEPDTGQHLRTLSLDSPAKYAHVGRHTFKKPWLDFCAATLEVLRLGHWDQACLPDKLPRLKFLELNETSLRNENGVDCPLLTCYKGVIWNCDYCATVRSPLRLPKAKVLYLDFKTDRSLVWAPDVGRHVVRHDNIKPDQLYAIECPGVESVTLRVRLDRVYYLSFKSPDIDWCGQYLGIENFLEVYGSGLKSLTLRDVGCKVRDILELAFRWCPQLREISIEARQTVSAYSILDIVSQVASPGVDWAVDVIAGPWFWRAPTPEQPNYTYHVFGTGVRGHPANLSKSFGTQWLMSDDGMVARRNEWYARS